jgi:hypothetical protein
MYVESSRVLFLCSDDTYLLLYSCNLCILFNRLISEFPNSSLQLGKDVKYISVVSNTNQTTVNC